MTIPFRESIRNLLYGLFFLQHPKTIRIERSLPVGPKLQKIREKSGKAPLITYRRIHLIVGRKTARHYPNCQNGFGEEHSARSAITVSRAIGGACIGMIPSGNVFVSCKNIIEAMLLLACRLRSGMFTGRPHDRPSGLLSLGSDDIPHLFGPFFAGPSWNTWHASVKGTFGEPLPDGAERAVLMPCWTCAADAARWRVGDRGGTGAGKDSIASFLAAYLAVTFDPRGQLRPGEAPRPLSCG